MASWRLKNLLAARGAPAVEEMVEASEGVAAPQQLAVSSMLSADVKVGEGNAAGGEDPVEPVANEVSGNSIRGEVRDVTATVLPEANTKVDEAGDCLVGRYIGRSSSGRGRILIGKLPSCDNSTTRLLSVMIEDGNGDNLWLPQFRELLRASVMKVSCQKRKLDSLVSLAGDLEVKGPPNTRQKFDACKVSTRHAVSRQTGSGPDVSNEAETSCNSSDFVKETPSHPCVPVKAVELPPSSGDLAVPEESITYLFYVYNFLRSFSVPLFLSPFGLDDFVAAINCTVQNNLLDAIHVSLLRVLRRHLETKSAEGSKLASNCLKYVDWALLDALTWPTFLLEYLCVMGCVKNIGGQIFGRNLLTTEYYKLPIVTKLRVLQILCDHVTDSEVYNEEMEYEIVSSILLESGSGAESTSAPKASAYKRINSVVANASQNGNCDYCRMCGMDGTLVRCDGCPWAYHSRCIGLSRAVLPQWKWYCPECVIDKLGTTLSRTGCGAGGDQIFGIDMCKRLFIGSCNYLVVIETSSNTKSYARYYNHNDVVKVFKILAPSDSYTDICRGMIDYWKNLCDIFHWERLKIGNEVCRQTWTAQNSIHNAPINGASRPSAVSHHNMAQMPSAQGLFRPVLSTSDSGVNGISREDTMSTISPKSESYCPSYQSKHHLQLIDERSGTMSGGRTEKLSCFKPEAYMNLYTHGNIALSAAHSLAVLKAEECKVSSSQMDTNPKKKIAAENALQLKAFSLAATQFVWPSTEKKLMNIPRDRCGWCLACRSTAIGNKKACFLNAAAANAADGSARVLSNLHIIKNSDSHFASIVAYLANMEESLRGLLVGPLQHIKEKQRWHKQLHEASSCRTVAPLLLELESNINGIAFSASWSKLIDEWPVESPSLSTGAYQQCGTGGRWGRKRLFAFESEMPNEDDYRWTWWSGGNISKRILQRGAHLSSIIRKAARQGGKKRMASTYYYEDNNIPRHTRQFTWRAWVELSQNSSQLALQVRYLDAHIRWKEFVPPGQIPSGGNDPDVDFSALRNAVICDKKIVDNRIRYAIKLPNENPLPGHVTANILEVDKTSKFWFLENHVPLYMVREFEHNAGVSSLSVPGMLDVNCLTNFCPRRVKAFIGDVFSYLFQKADVYPCTTCKKNVPFRDIVKCSSCQGNCHKECTSRSVDGNKGSHAAPSMICKLCLQKRSIMLTSYTSYSTNGSYLRPQQKPPVQQSAPASKIMSKFGSSHSAEPAMKLNSQPVAKVQVPPYVKAYAQPIMNMKAQPAAKVEAQPTAKFKASPVTNVATPKIPSGAMTKTERPKSEKTRKRKNVQSITYFGLVWKKNKSDNGGRDFRANDVILKNKDGVGLVVKPICCLCKKSYSPDFLYVRCEKCRNWFHGDALQLEEDKADELVAYCCCRCRKRAIPHCPHSDDNTNPGAEINEQNVAIPSESTILSGKETSALSGQDPQLASNRIVELIGKGTMDANFKTNMVSFTQGGKLSVRSAP